MSQFSIIGGDIYMSDGPNPEPSAAEQLARKLEGLAECDSPYQTEVLLEAAAMLRHQRELIEEL